MTTAALNVSNRVLQAFFGSVAGLPPTFWFLWTGTLVNRIGSFVMPMLAVYLTQQRQLSLGAASTVVSLFGVGSLLATQVGGVLADRIGRRTTMLLSLFSSSVCMLALGFAQTAPQLMVAAFALGATSQLYHPASQAMLADVVPGVDRVRAFGLLYWAINLGFSLAAVLGGQLARWSFTGLFLVDAGTTLTTAVLLARTLPETRPERNHAEPTRGSFVTPLLDSTFRPYLLVQLVVVLVFFQFHIALPADMQNKGLGPGQLGLVLALNGVLIVVLQPYVTRRLGGVRRSRALAIAALCVGFGFGANVFATGMGSFMLAVAIWTMGEIIMAPLNSSIVADLSPADMRGRYQGAFSLVWSLGVIVAPWLSGKIIDAFSMRTLWLGCIAVGVLGALGHLALGPGRLRRLQQLQVDGARD
ncbi:MAG: MFS transporter [Archangiaceae bacterium]|nr:MFS transporter [Archangiaceae bacterium]